MTVLRRLLPAVALLPLLVGCGTGGASGDAAGAAGADGVGEVGGGAAESSAGGEAALLEQRTAARETAVTLLKGARRDLGGRVRFDGGAFHGCESVFPYSYRSFSYSAQARLDAGAGAQRPFLESLRPVLEEAGFTVDPVDPVETVAGGAGRALVGSRAGLRAGFTEFPGRGRYVLLWVAGPCVEVPEEARDDWVARPDPTPLLGAP